MALEYFLYKTTYTNTLIDRSNTSFAPLPPDTGEIQIDYLIPEIQPLYYYKESGNTIVLNDEVDINWYLFNNSPAPQSEDNVNYNTFTGYTNVANTCFTELTDNVTGLSASVDSRFNAVDDDITGLTQTFDIYTGTTGLQEVTDINAITTNESTFNSGLVTNTIRPTGDTSTAIQINNVTGGTVININTASGFTGFGTETPVGLIHIYGTDVGDDDVWGLQSNAIKIDGPANTDKDIVWMNDGTPKWAWQTYRDEEGEFIYLYQPESQNQPMAISQTGRIGINKITNLMNEHVMEVVDSGLNDLYVGGIYTENYDAVYQIEINSTTGVTDTYHWRKSINAGYTFGNYSATSAVTITETEINHGITINFDNLTGHTIGTKWEFGAFTQIPQATFSIAPMILTDIYYTNDYNASTIEYDDITIIANGGAIDNPFNVFSTGTTGTDQALYWGTLVPINSMYYNKNSIAESVILVVEYYNGSTWIALTEANNDYYDKTLNLSKSGEVIWSPNTMTNWNTYQLPDTTGESFRKHWMRIRTAANPTVAAIADSISIGNDKRFSVYGAFSDYTPNFFVNSSGNISIGGGNIVGNNCLQVSRAQHLDLTSTASSSFVEFDAEDSESADIKIRLSSEDDYPASLTFAKTRGTLNTATGVINGDCVGRLRWRTRIGNTGHTLSEINTEYTGDGASIHGDLVIHTINGSVPVERIRIKNTGTGFGINNPTAIIHLQSGSTSLASLKFNSGNLLSSSEEGAVEFQDDAWYGTITGDTRKTFAFLESPVFTGNPELPTGTTLNSENLLEVILISGGSSGNFITTTNFNTYTGDTDTNLTDIENDITYISGITDTKLNTVIFDTYTGNTIPWTQVNKTGSDLADLETHDAVDVDINVPSWGSNDVDDVVNKFVEYTNETQGSGRISPKNVGFGLLTDTLIISGGTGYITYDTFHKKITWTGCTFNLSGYSEGLYYAYVDVNSVVHVIDTKPDGVHNIVLVIFYFGGVLIGVIQQSGCLIENALTRTSNYLNNLGVFIIDDNGLVQILSGGDNLKLVSPSCKVQQGLLLLEESEISSNDALSLKYMADYVSIDQEINVNWYFSKVNEGRVITDRWNDVTKKSKDLLTGYTAVFTNGSNLVTSTSDLTSFISSDDYIYLSTTIHSENYMTPVSGITWTGSETQITLDTNYSGATGSGTTGINHAMPKIPSGKYVKTGIFRTVDNQLILVMPQQYHNTLDNARDSSLALLSDCLECVFLKMAYLVYVAGETDLTDKIYDIRPLPFHYKEGGQIGGGVITSHGDLSGLSADDHTQYLKTDGSRNITGIQQYGTLQTFTNDLDIVSKKYVDDVDVLNLNISTFSAFTGTTLPATYLTIANFNAFTGTTIPILAGIENDINYVSGVTDTKLDITTFNTFTGTTIPILAGIESKINYVSGVTDTKLFISDFNAFTGTTLPANYYNKTEIDAYSAATASAIALKANINSPTFTGIPAAPTAAVNTNTTQIATTTYVINQAANVNPLMDSTVAIGTSLRYARQDHIHPNDTSKENVITGAATTITQSDLTINKVLVSNSNGKVAISNTSTTELEYLTGITGNVQTQINNKIPKVTGATSNIAIFDASGNIEDSGVNINTYGTEYQLTSSLASSSTTSSTPQTKVSMTTSSLPAGTYKILVAWLGSHTSVNTNMVFDITLNTIPQGTATKIPIEVKDTTTVYPLTRIFYLSLSGVNTILLRYWSEGSTTIISDATIELIRVT